MMMPEHGMQPWRPQTDSELEILRPFWDLWAAQYEVAAMFCETMVRFYGSFAMYSIQKRDMLKYVQERHDAGLKPQWWG
jgi:hypothetical protein